MRMNVCAGVVAAGVVAAATCVAQQPKVVNAQVSTRSGASLAQEIGSTQAATWIGYSIPVVHVFRNEWNDSVVYLEGGEHRMTRPEPKAGDPVPRANVLLRVTAGKVERVQLEDVERQIDGGGLPFVWLTDVKPADSVRTLSAVVEAASAALPAEGVKDVARSRAHLESAMVAIALEDAPEALPALRGFTAEKYPRALREKAAFWLANERGREGLETVSAMLKNDKDDVLREKLVFDLTLVKGDAKKAATDELLSVAKNDPVLKVRTQAQFWLAQMASRTVGGDGRVTNALRESAESDPNIAMRKSAVFALSRLPEEQGVPELIQVASNSKDVSTRKEAIFWLGRAKDPRALAYLEKVVKE